MAAPKKSEHEKRSNVEQFRSTNAEREYIKTQAAKVGVKPTTYMRSRVLGHVVSPARSSSYDPALVSELNIIGVALKSGIGNNLNQYMRNFHSERGAPISASVVFSELQDVLAKLDDALNQVLADDT